MTDKSIFHVHTYRCGHAEEVSDRAYIESAIGLKADSIWFTDHAPFPGDPFGSRMKMEQLEEYLTTLTRLKEEYSEEIAVRVGLEIEYFPSFDKYYQKLRQDSRMDMMLLGQHIYELSKDRYNFSLPVEKKKLEEYKGCGNAILQAVETGYFDVIAHPDRIFRHCREWTPETDRLAEEIIRQATVNQIPLEYNMSSEVYGMIREEFWKKVPDGQCVIGCDAHSIRDMEVFYELAKSHRSQR